MSTGSDDPSDFQAAIDSLIEQRSALETRMEGLTLKLDAEYLFLTVYVRTRPFFAGPWHEPSHGHFIHLIESAALRLYPRFGLEGVRDLGLADQFYEALEECYRLDSMIPALISSSESYAEGSASRASSMHADFVRGDAYPRQTRRRIVELLGPFEDWFTKASGIGPLRALLLLDLCIEVVESNAANVIEDDQFDWERIETLPASLEQVIALDSSFTQKEWQSLRDLIGVTADNVATVIGKATQRRRQLYFLSNDGCVFAEYSSLYDAVFDAFDLLAKQDEKFRQGRYSQHITKWIEREVVEHLCSIFPSTHVYRSLDYMNPDPQGGSAELDAAVVWEPFVLLIEVKAKQFRDAAREGDPSRLHTDLDANISEAYVQCARAMRHIEKAEVAFFVERGTKRVLEIRKSETRDVFPISVTLRQFGFLQTDLAQLKSLGLFKDSHYPWSVSVDDLEVIAKFIELPDFFVHYIRRRIQLQESPTRVIADELDLFGHQLDMRLHPSMTWDRRTEDGKRYDVISLVGASERFDPFYDDDVVELPPVPTPVLPPFVNVVMRHLGGRRDRSSRLAAQALLDLRNDLLRSIDKEVKRTVDEAASQAIARSINHKEDDTSISVVVVSNGDDLPRLLTHCVERNMYTSRCTKGLGVGIELRPPLGPLPPYVLFEEKQWVYDEIIERKVEEVRKQVARSGKLPGRNKRCFCGSGRKFKDCCLKRVNDLRRLR